MLQKCKDTLIAASESTAKAENERREKAKDILDGALKQLNSNSDIITELKDIVTELKSFEEDVKSSVACSVIDDALHCISTLLVKASMPSLAETKKVLDYLKANMPKYVYLSLIHIS